VDGSWKSSLFYRGADGRSKLRAWVIAALLILALLAALGGYSLHAAGIRQAQVQATARPVRRLLTPGSTPILRTVTPTAAQTAANCPGDSSDWDFVAVQSGSSLRRIDPPCVYRGLDKPIAWILAAHGAGYSNQDAVDRLAFTELPFDDHQGALDLLPDVGDKPVTLAMAWFPLQKDFQEWYAAGGSVISEVFVLNGCYRTYDLIGNGERLYWSPQYQTSSYTAICEVAEDRPDGWIVSRLGGSVYSTPASSRRLLAEFGYDDRPEYHSWYFLGYSNYLPVPAGQLGSSETALQQELSSPLWDLAWLSQTYGLGAQALPSGWQSDTSQADARQIAKMLGQ